MPFQKATGLSVFPANCLNRISPLSHCNSCLQICPQQAISITDDTITADACTLCGLCTLVCPTQVFQIDQRALLAQSPGTSLQLCCHRHPDAPADAFRLNCLQQLTPLFLMQLLYRHPHITLYLHDGACRSCSLQWVSQSLLLQLAAYEIPDKRLTIRFSTAEMPAENPDTGSRRDLFRNLFQRTDTRSRELAAQAADSVLTAVSAFTSEQPQPEIFPVRLPLYALYAKKQLAIPTQHELPFRSLQCTACNFCGACVHLCPVNALVFTQQNEEQQLQFHPELCINCNLCTQLCMQHGLQWDDFMTGRMFLQTPHTLAHSTEQTCPECQHSFYRWPADEDSRCSFCKPRQ